VNHGICLRVRSIAILAVIVVFVLQTFALAAPIQPPEAQPTGPKIWLGERQQLPMQAGGAPAGAALLAGHAAIAPAAAQPLSLTTGDVDEDGITDLLVGYAGHISIQRGNLDAFAPQSDASLQAIGREEFPAPFLAQSSTLATPVNPDFMAVGHFTGSGHNDLVIAAKGGTAIVVFAGDGKGNFAAPQTVDLPGGVTALAAGDFGAYGQFTTVLVGTKGIGKSFSLVAMAGSSQGLAVTGAFPLSAAPSSIDFANFGGTGRDAAFLAGGQIFVLRSSMQVVPVSLPVSARAFALGSFIFDRSGGTQIAVLAADGSVQIAARSEFDPRTYTVEEFSAIRQAKVLHQAPPLGPLATFPTQWEIVDTFPGVGTLAPGQTPVFFRTRVSSNGADDIMWLNAGNGQMAVISHPDVPPGAQTFAPGQVSIKPYTGSPVNALPLRINIDGRPGVLAIHQGEAAPSMSMPIPDPTFFPNRFDDIAPRGTAVTCLNTVGVDASGDCTLREAVIKANTPVGTSDNIQLQAGTYTLTRGRSGVTVAVYDAQNGTLNINDSLNITGAVDGSGNPTSIITWGALTSGISVDMIMSVNEDINPLTNATVSISNVIFQNGVNHGQHSNDGDGGCMEYDTGTSGNANLTLTNVIMQNCATLQGGGGGLVIFNFLAHNNNGFATISNSTFQNNSAVDNPSSGVGGGIAISNDARMVMTNSKVLNNLATQVIGGQKGQGGGIMAFFPNGTFTGNPETIIHSSTISGNKAAGFGGGMQTQARLQIDQGTVISNNVAGIDSTNTPVPAQDGGGLYINNFPPASCPPGLTCDATLTHVTITGNTATGNGGGISNGNAGAFPAAGPLTMTFSRLAGNSATGAGSNLKNGGTTVSATDDWWGTDAAATTINTSGGGTTTFDPFIVLTHNATQAKIKINGTSILTGDMSKDNHGTAVAAANLDRIIGLPITFNNPVLGSIPQAQPETLNASAQATATFNAGGISGRGSANATVDQAVIGANSNLIASATEAGTTATITTVGTNNFAANETVVISGVGVGGYNGTFTINSATPTTFTYTANTVGLGVSSGGTANVGIIILEPPTITKSFGAATIPVNGTTTVNFSINNPNVVAINGSFTDTLPPGLQVAATPGVVNTCGGTVTAVAGAGSISFSNNLTPIGICTISVNITGTIDNNYTNNVQILSADAGNGNTSSANITVINPPSITKAFGASTIPLNGTTSLTFTLNSTNVNLTLNGVAFTDSLPAGLVVASTPNLSNTCGGTATAVAGSSSVSLSGATLAPNASCTVSVDVQGTTAGIKNNSVTASSTNGGTGNTSNASITVVAPPTISKAFGAATIPLNGTTSLSFTINNPNTTTTLTGVGFSDTLPAGLVISTPNGLTGTCGGGTITATAGTNVISLSGASLAASASCTFSVNVTGITAGVQNNTTGNVTSTEGGTGGTASASINVVAPPSITKAFNPSTIALNATTSLTFTITNPAANTVALTGVAFTDTLPTGLTVASASATVCGGTLTTTSPTGIALTGATIAANGQCQFSVTVTGAASGQYTNTTGSVSSTNGGTGNTASANLTVASPPSITKAFGAANIPLNGTTSLTFTIQNPNTGVTLNGIAFTDNLPAGLVVATPNALNNTCGGTATAVAGSGSISLSAGTLAASASCTVSVNVQGTTAGVKNNSVQVTSTEGGTGNTSNASITVVGAPTIQKAFGAASIPLNGSTSLSFTITNPNTTTALTGVAFSDTLPAGLVISTPNGLTGTCGAGTITATAGTNAISLSGGTIAASGSCTFSINVTGTAAGLQTNTTGNVTSTEGGTGGTATASVKVEAPPSIAKVFAPSSIALNATTSLTFTITNPAANVDPLTGVGFTDTLPTGLTVANASATVCGGTLTTTSPTGIALTGATIAVNSQCQFSVTVTGAASGQFTNTTGSVTSTNGGTGNTASANLTVATPASITKAFGAAQIPLNGTTSLTFTIQNPNTNLALTGLAFTDNLPAGLVVATPSALNNTCGGTATAVAGSGSISLSAGTLAASASCTVSVNVQGTTAGVKNNSVQVTSTEGGTGNTSNASITVVAAPTLTKAFGAASIPLNGSTSLSFTVTNPNTTATFTGVGFSDTLPAGLVISTPNGLTGSCGGGTITATQGTNVISLSGATLAANASCTFSINVTGIAAGTQNNTTSAVTSTEGGTGGTASASINVVAPPSIAKAFNPSNIALNATTSLTFTITNPAANAVALTGVAFTDTLPAGLTVANASATVCGGTLTTTSPTGIALTGAIIAANSQCQFAVTVTGAAAGQYTNTTGSVTSTNGGTGNTASANLSVAAPPTITKAFGAASILLNANTSLTFTLNNPNSSLALTGVAFSDTLPAGLQVTTPNGLVTTCTGTVTAAAGSGSISLTGATLAANANCKVSVNVQGIAAGVQNNTTGPVSSTESGPGATSNTASITVIGPPSIAKAFGAASINLNGTTTLSFTITNPNATVALTGVGFGDTLPAGLTVATPNGLTGSCGAGTITTGTVSGFSVVNLSGGTIAAGGSCTFSVNVVGTSGGHKVNTTGTVSSTNAGSGNQATATIDVNAPDLAITKTHSGTFTRGQTGAIWTITVSNVGFGPTVGTVSVVDTLPAVANPPVPTALSGTGWTCTLATLTCTRADALASGSSYPVITLTVNIPKNIQNNFTNKATVSGGGDVNPTNNTATDSISLGPPIIMTPQSSSVNVVHGSSANMVINVDAPDPTLGVISFSCSGLPAQSICNFSPGSIDPAVTPGPTAMTVSVFTTRGTASLSAPARPGAAGRNSLYAMFAFPVFGVVLAGFGRQRANRVKLRSMLILLGLVLLLAIVGCGVAPPAPPPVAGTPAGSFAVTITATSTGFTATTSFNLVVQ
jgi:uncharacterized repeat protein (TIGR01451 family)